MEPEKKKLKILDLEDYEIVGRHTADAQPRSSVPVLPSPLGQYQIPGHKCAHGVYIPCTSPDSNRAEFCSLCYPYIVQERSNGNKIAVPVL